MRPCPLLVSPVSAGVCGDHQNPARDPLGPDRPGGGADFAACCVPALCRPDRIGQGVGNQRITPGGWEQRTGQRLRFVYRRGQPSLLVAETRLNSKGRAVVSKSKTGRGLATVPIFILVPQVKLPKRLSLEGPVREAEARLPGLIVANWREVQL